MMAGEGTRKKSRKKESLSPGEKRRLRQLLICLVLFGVVFVGRGMDLGPVSQLSATVGELVRADTDFQAVFARMGESFSKGEPAVETFRSLWSGMFSQEETPAQTPEKGAGAGTAGGPGGAGRGRRGWRGKQFIAPVDSG